MIFRTPPARACALVVGVERSLVFADDPLVGPVRDAMRWCEALETWGVPAERVHLFASPWAQTEAALADWCRARGRPVPPEPTQKNLLDFVNVRLRQAAQASGGDAALIIVWSGHGQINQRDADRTRRLYYQDSTPDAALNLEIASFMTALRSEPYEAFREQLLIVDACANYTVGFSGGRRLLNPTDFLSARAAPIAPRQQVLLAAAPGQVAKSVTDAVAHESVSQYSHELLVSLAAQAPPAGTWPDFMTAHRTLRLRHEQAADSTPMDWCDAEPDDMLPPSAVALLADAAAARLLPALNGIAESILLDAYYAALQGLVKTQDHHAAAANPTTMALSLSEAARPPGQPGALARWAAQIEARLDDPHAHPRLQVWLQDQDDADDALKAYRRAVGAERRAGQAVQRLCFVLVREEGLPDGRTQLQGWLFAGSPMQVRALCDSATPLIVEADGRGRGRSMHALLDAAAQAAHALGIEAPDFIFELAVPDERLDADLDALPLSEAANPRTLGSRHAVMRRMDERLQALARGRVSQAIVSWKRNAGERRACIDSHGLRIAWISPDEIVKGLLPARLKSAPQASCVGLARTLARPQLDADTRTILFEDGLPYACWTHQAWTEEDDRVLHRDLAEAKGALALHHFWRLRAEAGFVNHPSTRLHLLWDDPSRNPYDFKLKATER